jgi:hypothetical protein
MTRITVDAQLGAKLAQAEGFLEICDSSGEVLGYFHPALRNPASPSLKELSPFSDEEIEEFRRQPGGRSLAEIWRDLASNGGTQ